MESGIFHVHCILETSWVTVRFVFQIECRFVLNAHCWITHKYTWMYFTKFICCQLWLLYDIWDRFCLTVNKKIVLTTVNLEWYDIFKKPRSICWLVDWKYIFFFTGKFSRKKIEIQDLQEPYEPYRQQVQGLPGADKLFQNMSNKSKTFWQWTTQKSIFDPKGLSWKGGKHCIYSQTQIGCITKTPLY